MADPRPKNPARQPAEDEVGGASGNEELDTTAFSEAFRRALADISSSAATIEGRTTPLFFPNGINYIEFGLTPPRHRQANSQRREAAQTGGLPLWDHSRG